MKEMIYQIERKIELLDTGDIDRFTYYVLSLGTHPCAYVKIPKNHPLFGVKYDSKIAQTVDCHCGLTYAGSTLIISQFETLSGWFIGWDYAHCFDFMGYSLDPRFSDLHNNDDKKWTTEEIVAECKKVIEQLKGMK